MADGTFPKEPQNVRTMSEENIYDIPRGSEALSEDVTSEAESVCEEERVRKLFQACDADGDGYIDSQDLLSVCRELNLEDSLDELMRELGADESGRISYAEFLRRRLALRSEIDALRREQKREQHRESSSHTPQIQQHQHQQMRHRQPEPDYIPTSSDNSLGGASGGKHESWEFDSGARDLSPEPASLQKLVEAAGGSTVSSSPAHLLDLANRLHLAALASLKAEVSDLTNRLHAASADRDLLEKSLNKMQLDKMRVTREAEDRLEAQAQRYEERLTELHSVIAELSRKLERQRSRVIREDEEIEEEDEELAEEDYEEDCSHNYVPSDTEELSRDVDLTVRAGESGEHVEPIGPSSGEENKPPQDATSCTSADIDNRAVEAGQSLQDMVDAVSPSQMPTLQQPSLKDLLDEIAFRKEESSKLQAEVARARSLLSTGRDERDKLRKKVQELQSSLQSIATLHSAMNSSNQESPSQSPRHLPSGSPIQTIKQTVASSPAPSGSPVPGLSTVPRDEIPVLKMAERVKLRRMETGDRHVTASDLSGLETWSTPVAEQLVLLQGLQGESSVQELLCRYLVNSCSVSAAPSCTESAAPLASTGEEGEGSGEERLMQQVAGLQQLLPLREFELETERLRARGEHLRAQCDVLTLALDEARANAEKLTLLCGKYESNTTALWLALSHSDAALEAYDVLLALLESELAALVATCRAAGIPAASHCPAVIALAGDHDSPGLALARAGDIRQTAESVASLLLAKLDRTCDSGNQDGVKHHGEGRGSWSQGEESRLRNHIGRLKLERSRVRATAQPGLESIHADPAPPRGRNPPSVAEARKLDLETAVLMQELMAMREDRAELRARCHALERERATLELRLSGQEAQRQAQGAALSSLQQQLKDSESRLSGTAVGEEGEGRELTEALAREARLKERLQEMMVSLDTVSRSADIRHQQANEMLTEMKRANSSLAVMLDKCKKKYQARLRKLEHQSVVTIERHSTQVRALKQRISALESELAASNPPSHGLGANETSL